MSNPLDEYLELTKEAGFMDLARGAWRGFSGGAKHVAQEAQGQLPGFLNTAKDMVNPSRMPGLERGYALGEKAQVPAMALGAGSVLAGGAAVVRKIQESIGRRKDFKTMMQTDPELGGIQKEQPAFFNQAYNSLRRMNPQFGSDPIVAGSYMRKMMSNPDAAGLTLAQTVKAPSMPGSTSFQADVGPFKIGL